MTRTELIKQLNVVLDNMVESNGGYNWIEDYWERYDPNDPEKIRDERAKGEFDAYMGVKNLIESLEKGEEITNG